MQQLPVLPVQKVALICAASLCMKARDCKDLLMHELRLRGYTGPADAAALHQVLARAAVGAARFGPVAAELAAGLAGLKSAWISGEGLDENGQAAPVWVLVLPWDVQQPLMGPGLEVAKLLGVFDAGGLAELLAGLRAEAARDGWELVVRDERDFAVESEAAGRWYLLCRYQDGTWSVERSDTGPVETLEVKKYDGTIGTIAEQTQNAEIAARWVVTRPG